MPMNNRLLRPLQTPGLLDLVPGAAAAYSLRSLSRSYADPVVTVRRSSDDDEGSFTASEVADGTLAAWCGAGDGFVKQWWDQSGNENHAVAAADPNEPQIVDSGVVILEEGAPAIKFDGSDDYFTAGSSGDFDALHNNKAAIFAVMTVGLTADPDTIHVAFSTSDLNSTQVGTVVCCDDRTGFASNAFRIFIARGVSSQPAAEVSVDETIQMQQQLLLSALIDASNATADDRVSAYVNSGLRLAGNTRTYTPSAASSTASLHIGRDPFGLYDYAGYMQCAILYQSDMSSQRELIEGNIAWSYSQ